MLFLYVRRCFPGFSPFSIAGRRVLYQGISSPMTYWSVESSPASDPEVHSSGFSLAMMDNIPLQVIVSLRTESDSDRFFEQFIQARRETFA